MSKKRKHKISHDKYIITFTKRWVARLLWFGCIWITWSYVLATIGKDSIAESLSQTVAKVIIATVISYMTKAFFETYSEKHNELKRQELTHDSDDINETENDKFNE